MKCAVHPEVDATGYCRNCGKALCASCSREVRGMIYCESCLADMVTQPRQPALQTGSPAAATFLGFVPGLGAVYNGQYMKAIVHVLIFASMVGILSGDHPNSIMAVTGILLGAFIIYMAVDANISAKARLAGTAPTESWGGGQKGTTWPFILMGIGVLFLLQNFNYLNLDNLVEKWWPLGLIIVGAMLAWRKMEGQSK
jgi:hypothetical protein